MVTVLRLFFFVLVFSWHSLVASTSGSTEDQDQFIYNGFDEAGLLLDGIAKFHPNGLLQLTNTTTQEAGHAFYRFPVRLNKSASSGSAPSYSFSTNFVFSIIPMTQDLGGHGLAFVISPSTDFRHTFATQYLGLFNSSNNGLSTNHVLAVEFDTVLGAEFYDIDNNHVGVDVNSLISRQSAAATYFSNEERRNITLKLDSGDPVQVWIDYDEVMKLLNVTVAPIKIQKPSNPLLSTSVDLSEIVLDSMHIGFSASTGMVVSSHYILGWSFNRSGPAQSLDISKLPHIPRQEKGLNRRNQLILSITIVILLIPVMLFPACYFYRRRKFEELQEEWEKEYGPQRFSYKTLYKATEGFKEKQLLGSGGFGKVYRGTVPCTNEQIAVKRINHDSEQGMKEFVSEIVTMGRLRHRNLVPLLGYCRRRKELLLVYEYMPNGSLDKFLYGNGNQKLTWSQRFHIVKGVASALLYLHEEWEQVVLVGTLGYLAPELARTGKATTNSDVYAFGAFLLEVACGRKPLEPQQQAEEVLLVDRVANRQKREAILDAADPRLEGNFVAQEMELVLTLGLLCSQSSPEARPLMKQVVQYLQGHADLEDAQSGRSETGLSTAYPEVSIALDPYQMPQTGPDIEISEIAISICPILSDSSQFSLSRSDSVIYIGR